MKLTEKEQVMVLDMFDLMSRQYQLTDDEKEFVDKLNSNNPNYKLSIKEVTENNLRNDNYNLRKTIDMMILNHPIKIEQSHGAISMSHQAFMGGIKTDAMSSKYDAILSVLNKVYH